MILDTSLKVLLVGYLYGQGGIQNHTHWLATGLTSVGHSVSVLTPNVVHAQDSRELKPHDYQVVPYSGGVFGLLSSVRSFRAVGEFDVAVVCGTGWNAMVGCLANRRIKKRVFFEVMSGLKEHFLDPRSLIHVGFDALVGQAPQVTKKFVSEFGWSGAAEAIPAVPDPLEKAAVIHSVPLDVSNGLRAAYFGRLAEHKGVRFLIDNWQELSCDLISLDIFGVGQEENSLKKQVKDSGLEGAIKFHGRYPDGADYIELIQKHHMVLLPTTGEEGAPLVLLESMACGVPFVANGVGGIPQYANEDCRITSGDIAEFLPMVKELSCSLRNQTVSSQRLMSNYNRHFSFAALTSQWGGFLERICAN